MEHQTDDRVEELLPPDEREDLALKAEELTVVSTRRPAASSKLYLRYVFLPLIFLTVALLGGLRLDGRDLSLIFLKPPLFCLIFATIVLVLFVRSHLIALDGWFREDYPMLKNIANGAVLLTLFA